MRILVIPSWYPQSPSDVHGSFFREQTLLMKSKSSSNGEFKIGVIYPTLISVKKVFVKNRRKLGLVFEDDEGMPTIRYVGFDFFSKFPKLRSYRWKKLGHYLFEKYLKKYGRPDLIHAHSMLYGGVLAKEISQKYKIPFMITEHASGYSLGKYDQEQLKLSLSVARKACRCLAVSSRLVADLKRVLGDNKIIWEILPNVINSQFETAEIKKPRDPESNFVFLSVALLTKNKSIDLVLRAFSKVCAKHGKFVLRIGGDGPERHHLENLAQQLNISNRVSFLGRLERKKVLEEMSRADVFVLSSQFESFGLVVAEALACGLPSIATRCGGPESIIGEGDGLLVPVGDELAIENALVKVFENYNNFDPKGIRERCLSRFSSDVISMRLLKIYKEASQPTYHIKED